jgi:hypothetical protein
MTSVLYSSGGYNTGGNQLRVEIRNLTTRVDTLSTTLSNLKNLFISLHPDQAEAINTHFSGVTPPTPEQLQQQAQQQAQQQQVQAPRTPAQNAAVNRVRP